MINIKNVTKTYNGTHKAVDDVSIQINSGEIVGFIGPNGAGKTTTIKMLTGILAPDSGSITLNDLSIRDQPIEAKQQFGYVSDDPNAFLKLKGIEYLNFIADIYNINELDRQKRIQNYTQLLGMDKALNDKLLSYSHGMRQKIMVIGVLLHNPYLLILDEPLTGLDPQSSYILKEAMREHANQGGAVFFSTHVLEVAEKLCDKVVIINHGQIVYTGTLESLKSNYNQLSLEEIFLELTK
ncbi:ABC transporter ATP-binding protein [Erysipelothrix rhusiopathiae]|uniref:ABC transporter, ATP-binding protein n=1 Tax=Erysipelothrix rhusiopathiae ATCC 19414 TaxID=525280 RepID=E7FV87_ERYRH|nr:ABC transporter ATP-binding protein [Erysipelothrix rhusiopathiae]EFY09682.1 ABC transporter, ATP-binding protein [Erysipelothrix rhusiopathiae ATCC 19414]MDE8032597.1 ABC transporter ATP-binding protein [Erysipelothrix rhusiopathiae]MDE8035980.1 ABC transporter ATP-binding protein [Erysipelothrix rhusiopathiae]MDE8043407.1 ABC transporter ATP-binding protein [Erysipelothrix rhusiopathiae]MDE8050865.1 ABC transporter ATP-binding protein [Erysipelothrix rhusiopathiae]